MSFDKPPSLWVKDWYTPDSGEFSEMGYASKIKLNGWHRSQQAARKLLFVSHDVLDLSQWRYNDKIPIRRTSRDELELE